VKYLRAISVSGTAAKGNEFQFGTNIVRMKTRWSDWDLFYTSLTDDYPDGWVDELEIYCGGLVVYILTDPIFETNPERLPDGTINVILRCFGVKRTMIKESAMQMWPGGAIDE